MILVSFIFILTGICFIVAGILLLTLHIAGTGNWPGFLPANWDNRAKKFIIITGAGFLLTLTGVLAGYGI
ncbi:hypothetical protein [Desulfallas thermosapovorans]|uniref:Uncharacterized protein n=1 Tax=Desulfallas thermosapovorans DSM 6562 TaxID=1121431 RepID=A0A5S4ZUR9_9FIRM|nr:hypothetical protein [Desulfallas thermosapovorans]TYO95965.1 hypothetical protein LX24_01355 [Desulfallas thermosapovorans DSM 6562]